MSQPHASIGWFARTWDGAYRRLRRACWVAFGSRTPYDRWLEARLKLRRTLYPLTKIDNLFSILTPVHNTPSTFLRALGQSILNQDFPWFEWIILDNGSTWPSTRAVLRALARDSRVKLITSDRNLGIIGGTRRAFDQAQSRYIVPVDHDDLLYPDALRIMACYLSQNGFPAIAYSDEDKCDDLGRRSQPFCKPDWDPVLFMNCCYTAHLNAIACDAAREVGAYHDEAAMGCPDWDAVMRLWQAGHTPLHVPELLYSWRMHAESTAAAGSGAKPYTIQGQHHVLTRHLKRAGVSDRITIQNNGLLQGTGMWRTARRQQRPAPNMRVLLCSNTPGSDWRPALQSLVGTGYADLEVTIVAPESPDGSNLRSWNEATGLAIQWLVGTGLFSPDIQRFLEGLEQDAPVVVLELGCRPLYADWPWEAVGLFELHQDAVVVGGPMIDEDGVVASAGRVFGFDGAAGSPLKGYAWGKPGPFGMLVNQRTVSTIDTEFFVARAGFLRAVLRESPRCGDPAILSFAIGATARNLGQRVVYSPLLAWRTTAPPVPSLTATGLAAAFVQEHWRLLLDDPWYSPCLSLRDGEGYHLGGTESRAHALGHTLSSLAGHVDPAQLKGSRFAARSVAGRIEYHRLELQDGDSATGRKVAGTQGALDPTTSQSSVSQMPRQ